LELDFFGRHQAALQAALGQQQAARADLQAARVLLAANVARGYVALARLTSLRQVAERSLAQRQAMLVLTRGRVQAGLDTVVEQRQSEAGLPDARAQIVALDGQMVLARHQLAVLSGQAPQALDGLLARPVSGVAPLRATPPSASALICWAGAPTWWQHAGGLRPQHRTWQWPAPSSTLTSTWSASLA
jgi:outer membrane protein TolC